MESSQHIRIDGLKYMPLKEGADALTLALGWRHSNSSTALARALEVTRDALTIDGLNPRERVATR